MFKIATSTVNGYAIREDVHQRMILLSNAISQLSNIGVDLFCLPGGYFLISKNNQIHQIKEQVQHLAVNSSIDLLIGIDIGVKNNFPIDTLVELG